MYHELYNAWQAFGKGKEYSNHIDVFAYELEDNICVLADDIEQQTYTHGGYQRIVVQEKKRRDLAVATVRDRVVHRYVYDKLVAVFDASFDPDVWSCRKDKGLQAALERTQQLLQKYPDSYAWRADITKFFEHVQHGKLLECIGRRVKDEQILYLCREIITSYTTPASQPASQPARLVSCWYPHRQSD